MKCYRTLFFAALLVSGSVNAAYIDDLAAGGPYSATNTGGTPVGGYVLAANPDGIQLDQMDTTAGSIDTSALNGSALYNFAELFLVNPLTGNLTVSVGSASAGSSSLPFLSTDLVVAILDAGGNWIKGGTLTPGSGDVSVGYDAIPNTPFIVALIGKTTQAYKDAVDKTKFAKSYDLAISSVVPVPAAVWLFGTAMLGLIGFKRRATSGAVAA